MVLFCMCTVVFLYVHRWYCTVYFLKQILSAGKDSSAKRKRRTPRVFRLLSRIIGSRTSKTYQPKAEVLVQKR